jgi:flagellar protein FliO/FliZ
LRWLQSVFGSDGSPIVQYVVIFAVIFAALAAIVFTVRRLTGRSLALPGRAGSRGRQPRLGIVDVYELDRARQLILLRRDNVEHLLLVGGPNDVVVERNIQRNQRPLTEAALRPELAPDALDEPLPDPLVQGGRLPEPALALPEVPGRRADPLFDPGFAMPVVVPSPVPRSAAAPPVTLPLDAALLGGDEPGQDVSAPLSAPPLSPSPASPQPVAAPAVPPAPAREPINPRRILSRTAPPLAEAQPGPASERRVEVAGEPPPAPSLTVPSDRRTVDPAVLSDMARQLQAALSRPSSAVTPAPAPAASAPATEGVDPVAAAMASAPPAPEAPPAPPRPPVPPPVEKAADLPTPPAAASASPPVPVPPVPVPPAPAPVSRPVPPPPPPPQPALPKAAPAFPEAPPQKPAAPAAPPAPAPTERPDQKSAGNPFSVEEIEAEFARLLGRPLDKRS